ncbi:MAG: tetratricopeptide repeat protein, partial [Porphyrobacter sp.]|nr:tetratricopeptide repeat protein [Porphyrobacter sp.]
MALRPTSDESRADKLAVRRAAEQDVLLREVDEAVRQDEAAEFAKRHGRTIIVLVIVALAAFGGWLWWKDHREGRLEKGSEDFVQALDQIDAGDRVKAQAALAPIAQDGTPAAAAGAKMLQAGLLIEKGDTARATTMLFELADDKSAPDVLRNLAAIRGVSASFDTMKPDDVIARLKPLATPGNPWFASAGELVAMAYLKQGKRELAGP